MALKVVDLFCGPGGISEGLRQAGFASIYALDHDRAAVETFAKNHPEALVVRQDVTGFDTDALPEFDILVGGPPCVEFSASKGSRGNILEGLRLVQEFLRVVYERAPRYWIMENVPRIMLHLPQEIPLKWIGVDKPGALYVPTKAEFNCADYGVPQTRRRFLMGNFPVPLPTHREASEQADLFQNPKEKREPWRTLGSIISGLPNPLEDRRPRAVIDPNYSFSVPGSRLTDHFHPVALTPQEVRSIRRAKIDHPFMGRMAFPDSEDRPARTVVATQLGRETLVIGTPKAGRPVFRRATVRECATLQSFPLSYQFFGGSLNSRYRLVGDAVPPRLAYLIAREICRIEKLPVPSAPKLLAPPAELAPPASFGSERRKAIQFSWGRKFAELVPGKEVRGCRVELDNSGPSLSKAQLIGGQHAAEWCARLYVGEGKNSLKTATFNFEEAVNEVADYCASARDVSAKFRLMLERAETKLAGKVPDATTLQGVWAKRAKGVVGPEELVDWLAMLVNKAFPASEFSQVFIHCSGRCKIIPPRGLRIRLAAALLVTAYCCELANVDSRWVLANQTLRVVLDKWPTPGKRASAERTVQSPAQRFVTAVVARGQKAAA